MSSYAAGTDLWLERSRLDGMTLSAVSYGSFSLLTIQATVALTRRPRKGSKVIHNRWMLLAYVWITFVLATVGFAANARYTQMIWIDLRNVSGGPTALILNEMNYWINMMALACYYAMEWLMQVLLLYRCFVIWDWKKHIVVPMSTLYAAMVAMSILVLVETSGAVFYNINTELAYLSLQVGLTFTYTLLVAGRLFVLRNRMGGVLGREYVRPYETVATMIVESAAPYSLLSVIFILSFALHSYVSNLVLLSISHVQGIAQLLIIIRVAGGIAFEQTSQAQHSHTSVMFSTAENYKLSMRGSGRTDQLTSFTSTDRGVKPLKSLGGETTLIHSSCDNP